MIPVACACRRQRKFSPYQTKISSVLPGGEGLVESEEGEKENNNGTTHTRGRVRVRNNTSGTAYIIM